MDDGEPMTLSFSRGTSSVNIATGLDVNSFHSLLLHKRTEYYDGRVEFLGLTLDVGEQLGDKPPEHHLKLECYGDSITCGLALDANRDEQDNIYTNNYMAYCSQTARSLGAEIHTQAISGIGLVKSLFGGNLDMYWDLVDPRNPSSVWDFAQWVPNAVVVNLGQNDKWFVTKFTCLKL